MQGQLRDFTSLLRVIRIYWELGDWRIGETESTVYYIYMGAR
jgi:hypothetical protein